MLRTKRATILILVVGLTATAPLFLAMLLSFASGCSGHEDLGKAEDPTKAEPKMRKVADIGYSYSISSDGRFLVYEDGYVSEKGAEDHVFVLDLKTRERRRQEAQEKAAKIPVKITLPTVMFMFPTLFLLLLGPIGIDIIDTFSS